MNKNGGVLGLGLLPWFAMAVCLASLLAFASYNTSFAKQAGDVSSAMKEIDFNENYIISTIQLSIAEAAQKGLSKETFESALASHEVHLTDQGNLFVLAGQGQFSIDNVKENEYILNISGLFVSANTDTVKIRRNLDLSMEFNGKGEFIRFINK